MILIHGRRPLLAAAVTFVGLSGPAAASAQDDAVAVARRIAAIASIAADEYALGVAGGVVVSAAELDEARLFLEEADALARQLPDPGQSRAAEEIRALLGGVAALRPAAELHDGVERLRETLALSVGVPLDPMPRSSPPIRLGRSVFDANCTKCHGPLGAGDGPRSAELEPMPADLTDPVALAGSSPLDFFRKVTFGIAGTDMPSFEEGLTLDERWSVALYVSGLRSSNAARAAGAEWFATHCGSCRVWISDFETTVALSDDSLRAAIAAFGEPPTEDAVGYARTAAAGDVLGADRRLAATRMAQRVTGGIDAAIVLAADGDSDGAARRAMEAYLEFERVETAVGARSAGAARAVERAFADFRGALADGDIGRVTAARRDVDAALVRSVDVMSASASPGVLFGQSILIILREGLEAILIVGALAAFLVKAGARDRLREITAGVVAALGASLATAAAFATVWRLSAARREALEGMTMLLASLVLFTVASWLVSKVEAEKWRAFVQARMRHALRGGGVLALAGVSFLAVYREGFETVLFYGALFGTADDALGAAGIVVGLVVGLALLTALFVGIQRYGLRIPLRPFFAGTGILLTVLAVSFAGQGVAELQAAGWIPSTPIGPMPSLPALGVFPTVQTVAAQLMVSLAFGVALLWIFWLSPPAAASALPRGKR